jgi:hypothetical protein
MPLMIRNAKRLHNKEAHRKKHVIENREFAHKKRKSMLFASSKNKHQNFMFTLSSEFATFALGIYTFPLPRITPRISTIMSSCTTGKCYGGRVYK